METPGASPIESPIDLVFDAVVEVALPPGVSIAHLEEIARFVLQLEAESEHWIVTVALIEDERMQTLHRQFLNVDEPTDVMTFPFAADEPSRGGEIAISIPRAADQGREFGQPAAEEVAFLLVHGLLHLCGWDDATAQTRDQMLARQRVLLDDFQRQGGTGDFGSRGSTADNLPD